MNIADIIVLIILLLSSIVAFRLGFIRVVLSMTTWVGATFATVYGYPYASPVARDWIGTELAADIAAGAAIFVTTMILLTIVSHSITGSVRSSSLGMLDRSFGFLAGISIGAIIVSGGFIFSQQVLGMTDASEFYKGSKALPLVKRGANILAQTMPDNWEVAVPSVPDINRDERFRSLISPKPETNGEKRDTGYRRTERQEMDRLIRNHQ